jgi:hypothetical protein
MQNADGILHFLFGGEKYDLQGSGNFLLSFAERML